MLLLGVGALAGFEKAPPTPADLAKAPWLDPKVQMEGLTDGDMKIRGLSAFNLGNQGAAAAAAIPELEKLAKDDPEAKVRENAVKALEKIRSATGG
jgi:HEAT repeat protein